MERIPIVLLSSLSSLVLVSLPCPETAALPVVWVVFVVRCRTDLGGLELPVARETIGRWLSVAWLAGNIVGITAACHARFGLSGRVVGRDVDSCDRDELLEGVLPL